MDDIMEKLNDILSDEESMKQLSELAQMITQDNSGNSDDSASGSFPDAGSLMKLAGLAGSVSGNNKNTALLLALRPHLSAERQKRLDKAVRMLKLLDIMEAARESGLLSELL